MKGLGIDFKKIGTKVAGHAAGAAAYTQLNKLSFMKNQTKPVVKGLIAAAIGYIGVPMVAKKLKLGGNKNEFIDNVGEGIGMVGIMQAAGAQWPGTATAPGLFPTISGVDGYEENPIQGLGELYEENENVSGYESNPVVNGAGDAAGGDMDAV